MQALSEYGEWGYISTQFLTSHYMEVKSQIHATAALRPGKGYPSLSGICWKFYGVGNTFDIKPEHL